MGRGRRDWDESDVRVRPNPRGTRPRSKDRPRHEDAVVGLVTAVDRGRWTTLVDDGAGRGDGGEGGHERVVVAMRARELGRTPVVVGDRVALVGDVTGDEGTLARIVRVEERRSVLRRTADDTDPVERYLVAGCDQLVVVTALADPEPRLRLIDRCLVAAYDARMDPLLVLTKGDLAPADELLAQYAPLEVPALVTSVLTEGSDGLAELRRRLAGRMSVLVGHSGVGKSTLVNALVPDADRATGQVNDVTGRGRHTSSSAVALRLPRVDGDAGRADREGGDGAEGGDGPGWIVDTPGIRSFGLAHVDPDHLVGAFPDLAGGLEQCPRGCSHDEEECGLDGWVASGGAGPGGRERLDSLRRLLRALR